MSTIVTGATGFIGSHITRKLVQRGEKVKVLVRKTSNTKNIDNLDVEKVYGDVLDIDSLRTAFSGCDTLYHSAGYVSFKKADYKKMEDINVQGSINVLSAARDVGISKVLFTSSVAALGVEEDRSLITENTTYNLYGEGIGYMNVKYLAEKEALEFNDKGLPVVILNPSVVLGEGDIYLSSSGSVLWFCKKKFPGYMDGTFNVVDVEDVAEGHLLAAEKGKPGEKYILANKNVSVKEYFNLLEEITGVSAPKIKIPYICAYSTAVIMERLLKFSFPNYSSLDLDSIKLSKYNWQVDSSKAINELGFKQTPIEETIRKTVDWFRNNGFLN
ncbi:MAG: NAD-dependent epimerase/dehydratase family protein [Candidatus Dadabacteria bacterium]|nr:NAD-dependent epimerase/dehydratase family protein [Candidatus Dadabacteria bacterium]NIQ16214.1 NAD-dependent epimerase/dehydratase family protein [Candidatus Dadabacteria bacterium]